MPVGQCVFLVLTGEVGVIVRAYIGQPKTDPLEFRLHNPYPFPHRSSGMIEHRANPAPACGEEGVKALTWHRMDEVAILEVRADPAIEAMILPPEEAL